MVNACRGLLAATLWLAIALYPGGAFAAYVYTTVDVPHATFTTLWGVSSITGQAAADAIVPTNPFCSNGYQAGSWNPLKVVSGFDLVGIGINDFGFVVGGAVPSGADTPEQGFIYNVGTATYTFFSHPGWINTEARAIGNSGLVTGFAFNDNSSVGFIYNPATGAFTDIVPAANTTLIIAQGINAAGQVVGSFQTSDHAFGPGQTGFLREPDGSFSTFRVGGHPTSARGINDNGLIAGFVLASSAITLGWYDIKAFVGNSSGFQLLNVQGALQTVGEGLDNAGRVTGGYRDAAGIGHGFIFTPASLPTGTTAGGAYTFFVSVIPNVMIFIDPAVSLGFDYEIGTGDPKFASVQLPIGIGDSLYTLIVHGQAFALAGGDTFDFAAHGFANGVAQFRVADIEASAGLDPSNAAAFPTGLTFTTAGTFTGTMTPLCRSTPLPDHAKSPVGRGLSPCLSQ